MKCLSMIVASFALSFSPLATAAEQWGVNESESSVAFVAVGKPGFLKIRGEGARLKGVATMDGKVLTGTFTVALASLKTGIDLRDEHMKGKYLEVEKFPVAQLELDPLTVEVGENDYDFTGKLTLKGVTKAVAGKLALVLKAEGQASGQAEFSIKMSDFPVGVPSHMGVTVAESVDLTIDFVAKRTSEVAAK